MKRWQAALAGLVAIVLVGASLDVAQAQRGRRPRGGPPGMMGGFSMMGSFGGVSELALLRRPDVQKELELLDDQIKDLEKLAEDQRNSLRDMFSQRRSGSPEQRGQAMRDMMKKLQAKVDEILLPDQSERLKELALQLRIRRGLMSVLRDEELVRKLGISESSKQQLETKARELEIQLRKKMEQLRQQQVLDSLAPQQKEKLKQLLGKPFDFKDEPGGRRAPGGRR